MKYRTIYAESVGLGMASVFLLWWILAYPNGRILVDMNLYNEIVEEEEVEKQKLIRLAKKI